MPKEEEEVGKSGKYGVMANAVNFIGGVSFLGLPYAVKESGLIGGLLLLSLVAILTEASHRLIVESSKFHYKLRWLDINSYEALVAVPFGRYGELLLLFSVFVVAFGATVGFTVMIKDLLSTLLASRLASGGTTKLLALAWALLIVPLTLIRDLSSLTFVSVLSLGLSTFLLAVIIEEAPFRENVASHGGLLQVAKDYGFRPHIFTTFSIFTEVFAWQHGLFQFFNSLRRADIRRWRFVTSRVNTTISIIYILVSVPAYLAYLDNTTGDIFLSLPSQGTGSTLTDIARICFLFICIMTYPLEMLVARDVIKALLAHLDDNSARHTDSSSSSLSFFRFFLSGRDLLIVLLLDVAALGLGILFKDLGDTVALVGAIGGSLASFVIPGLVYLGVNGDDFITWTNTLLLGSDADSSLIQNFTVKLTDETKPWWFYILGFPIWCYIADWGATSVAVKLQVATHDRNTHASPSLTSFDTQDTDPAYSEYVQYIDGPSSSSQGKRGTRGKFLIAIGLVFIGFTTLVVGIIERF
jgi:sodium-coupled neutral amino acid transporter 11